MAARVSLTPGSRTNIARGLERKAAITIAREAARVAESAVTIAEQLARHDLYTDRPTSRRSRPGSRRYGTGFSAKVTRSQFPIEVTLSNSSKIAALIENGSPAHDIPVRSKTRLAIPQPPGDAHAAAYGSKDITRPTVAHHQGTKPYKIMERALRQAFRERGAALRATK